MTNSQKIEIAKDFVSFHKNNDYTEWTEWLNANSGEQGLINIYTSLCNGVYGEVRQTGFDDELEIEISSHDSNTNNPKIYTWDDEGHVKYMNGES